MFCGKYTKTVQYVTYPNWQCCSAWGNGSPVGVRTSVTELPGWRLWGSSMCFQGAVCDFPAAGYVFYCTGNRQITRIQLNLFYLVCSLFKDEIQRLYDVRNNSITWLYIVWSRRSPFYKRKRERKSLNQQIFLLQSRLCAAFSRRRCKILRYLYVGPLPEFFFSPSWSLLWNWNYKNSARMAGKITYSSIWLL